ncbi:MAG: S8/S53 family peptidase [Chloracidobacterium sp.]|nr:S8/S53 family peptidase [Chloracidobacterium sp.]
MASSKKRKAVTGSEMAKLPTMKAIGAIDPKKWIEITVLVRPRPSSESAAAHTEGVMDLGAQPPEERQYMSREEFAVQRGADPADIAKIDEFAHEHNLTVVETSIPKRAIKLAGTIADLTAAFKPNLKKYKLGGREIRGRTGSLSVPDELADIVVGVFGFDDRPAASPHYRRLDEKGSGKNTTRSAARKKAGVKAGAATPRNAADGSFSPPDVARLYNFPAGLDGSGQCIALIELNDFDSSGMITGAGFDSSDLTTYFKKLKIQKPQVTAVGVDGGANKPGPDSGADGEVMLDIEVAGAVAPGAKIAVYFAPNTAQGFIDAVNSALHDNVRNPSVISISWGGPEDPPFSTRQYLNAFNQIIQDAATLGVTICCASGDNGSSDLPLKDAQGKRLRDNSPHIDFPSSSPFALACGGTKLLGSGTTINSEQVWNEGDQGGAGGGGVSNFFARPGYQSNLTIPTSPNGNTGRGVPDVAGDADPATGYRVRVQGKDQIFGGTSAVAPLWAGLIALINQRLASLGKKPVGFINPILYAQPNVCRDIVTGNNDIDGKLGKYNASAGWDSCTGLGVPDGTKVMKVLGG